MKVFISQPMSSRTDEEVFETRNKIKQAVIDYIKNELKATEEAIKKIKFLSTYDDEFNTNLTVEDLKGKRENVFRLGHAIQLLSEADVVIFAPDFESSRGCRIERDICNTYNILYKTISFEEGVEWWK